MTSTMTPVIVVFLFSLATILLTGVQCGLPYEGVSINLACINVVAPNARRALNRTLSQLGLRVNVREFDFFSLYQELVTDLKAGSPFYDAFLIPPVWIPDLVQCQKTTNCAAPYLEDLTDRVRADNVLNWPDVNSFFRTYGALYSGKIYIIPMDGDVIFNYIRTDALSRPYPNDTNTNNTKIVASSWLPNTMEDIVWFAKQAHGRDLNGDGTPDYGSCIHRMPNQQAINLFLSFFTPVIQSQGTRAGFFFDLDTMKPLINNPETQRIAELYHELLKYSVPDEIYSDLGTIRGLYHAGRCAFTVDWGDIAIQANSSIFRDYILPIRSVGSYKVWDPASGTTRYCNDTSSSFSSFCPFADSNGVNYAPYSANGGWSGAISSQIPESRKKAAFDFLALMGSPEESNVDVLKGNGFEPYRKSQMTPEFLHAAHFPTDIANRFPDQILASLNFPNVVIDLRIRNNDFMYSFDHFLGLFNAGNITASEMLFMTEANWTALIDENDRRYLLDSYRATLDLPPKNYQVEYDIGWGARAALIVLSSICIFISFAILLMIIVYREKQEIRAASPVFCYLVVIGAICIFISLINYSIPVADAVCMSVPWMLNSGFVLLFASLLVKNYRIARIFSAHDLRAISSPIATRKLLFAVSFFMLLNFIILILWTSVDHLKVESTTSGVGVNEYQLVCKSDNLGIWIGALVVLDGVLLLLGCFISLQTRHIHQKMYNESTYIGLATYNYSIIALIVVPINILIDQPMTKFLIVGLGILIATISAILFLFLPKFYQLFFKGGKKLDSGTKVQTASWSIDANGGGGGAAAGSSGSNHNAEIRAGGDGKGKCNKCGRSCKYC